MIHLPQKNILRAGAFVIFMMAVSLVAGCGGNQTKDEAATITFWHFWSEPSQEKALKELIAEFEAKEHCTVKATSLSWGDGKTKLLAAFSANKAPDALELGSDWVAQFSSAGVLRPWSSPQDRTKYAAFAIPPAMFGGKQYALPWVVDTRVLFYNKGLLKKAGLPDIAPQTMSQMLAAAEKIQELDGVDGFGANGSDPHRLYKKFLPFVWGNGGDIFSADGKPTLNSPENIEALNMYITLARFGRIETQRELDAAFVQGKIGFWFSGSWLTQKIEAGNPSLDYGVTTVPGMKQVGMSFAGGEYLAVNAKSDKAVLAEKLARFLADGANTIKFCKKVAEAGFPADTAYFHDEYFTTAKNRGAFAEQLTLAKMTPVHPKWLDIEAALENAVVAALYGQKSAGQALSDAQAEVTTLLSR